MEIRDVRKILRNQVVHVGCKFPSDFSQFTRRQDEQNK